MYVLNGYSFNFFAWIYGGIFINVFILGDFVLGDVELEWLIFLLKEFIFLKEEEKYVGNLMYIKSN